jgi:hypothetical protein
MEKKDNAIMKNVAKRRQDVDSAGRKSRKFDVGMLISVHVAFL